MLRAKMRVGCDVRDACVCRDCEIVLTLRGEGRLGGCAGTVQGSLRFVPRGLCPQDVDSLGSSIACRLLVGGKGPMELLLGPVEDPGRQS